MTDTGARFLTVDVLAGTLRIQIGQFVSALIGTLSPSGTTPERVGQPPRRGVRDRLSSPKGLRLHDRYSKGGRQMTILHLWPDLGNNVRSKPWGGRTKQPCSSGISVCTVMIRRCGELDKRRQGTIPRRVCLITSASHGGCICFAPGTRGNSPQTRLNSISKTK